MHYLALATDYDGTLAHHGKVDKSTFKALRRFKDSGRKLIMVTGRHLEDLLQVFPGLEIFDRVVAENGALLYRPATREERVLGARANLEFARALKKRGADPLYIGRSIVATVEPFQKDALQLIQKMGLELQVIFNKGAAMILPSGVNKATGLRAALSELGISHHNVIGIGDAENDHALLKYSGCGVAVKNALDSLKETADIVTEGKAGEGVEELIDQVLKDDLVSFNRQIKRQPVLLGADEGGKKIRFSPRGTSMLIAGPSGSGKTTVTSAVLERVAKKGYQFCVIDPEGDYEKFPACVHLGDPNHVPRVEEVIELLEHFENPVVNLLGLPLTDRPAYFARLLSQIQELRARTGHPHWLVIDEAHHLFPADWHPAPVALPTEFSGTLMVTVHPDEMSPDVLKKVNLLIAVGKGPEKTIKLFCKALKEKVPEVPSTGEKKLDVTVWFKGEKQDPMAVHIQPGVVEHDRHSRKYAKGDLEEDAFYFRGPKNKLNLRAQNLELFIQIGQGVDEETWLHHLNRGDYSAWILKAIQDKDLARQIAKIEKKGLPAAESRERIRALIEKSYTKAA